MKNAVYPGSFDPLTNGHLNIIKRASVIFDNVTIAIGVNPEKKSLFTVKERVELINQCISELKNVTVKSYSGLTANFVKEQDTNIVIRGTRDSRDFIYEQENANLNSLIDKDIETILLFANRDYELISSSMVKEINRFGGDVSKFVPEPVEKALKEKKKSE
ncbi:pantetheine-phosphate adenylyltransferase [Fructilactobacillus lindneri]|uniref:Phosphopantetheine adenylyltransferase n=2 Tax=Fructilactobacillus lindneri TaxID=53444 RepID=A0A0R2JMB1_9LACO|nr:pantetheine-phosphate adenylyltransferase [Fructilactobacillus lindneri]ANZ58036.1 pantetheine-phosphate adenylyltransferase [Fructilactobacillus lindneri]ANZ59306.1 pantetheine-phosphate adenylyltransferase [Fructilactobacillus lindneri]KRN78334.1 phosphopantetheine adenylyltransferase [Fructilactobacillus lindneri DSM 20690 = JCM 11027]POG98857.1 pantetheine-phosphate adenylyltransferase [Fructilactobacillus lindneri]POH00114.1 pantetheine-phosphate adenylyltransferase [Fructilactobacillu